MMDAIEFGPGQRLSVRDLKTLFTSFEVVSLLFFSKEVSKMGSLMFCDVCKLNGWSFHKMNLRHFRLISYPDLFYISRSI